MKSFFARLFIQNWQRKALSIVLSVVIWLTVNHSLHENRESNNVMVRLVNLPRGKAVESFHEDHDLLLLDQPLPVALFYPPNLLHALNPLTLTLSSGGAIEQASGLYLFRYPVAIKGVSRIFFDVVKDHLQFVIVAGLKKEYDSLPLSLQVIDPQKLEDIYIQYLSHETSEEAAREIQEELREEYLRNRFRDYTMKMQLFHPDGTSFDLQAVSRGNTVQLQERALPLITPAVGAFGCQ